ncbi:MAG: hypothetical protein PHP44_02685 [Kiritimatiellae bacterium]|nr:hypothetical protein [Kiritimatiellia bacterium]MDD4734993.1 hypothetical protein [Kiritimatiellia bacterium]
MKKIGILLLAGLIVGLLAAVLVVGIGPVWHSLSARFERDAEQRMEESGTKTDEAETPERSRLAIGRMLSPKASASEAVPAVTPSGTSGESEALKRELARLRSINTQLQTQLAEILSWMLVNYKGRYPLAENQITNLSFHAATDTFELNPAVAEFMHLDSNEVDMISDLLSYGGEMVNELVAQNISVTESDSGKVVLHIPSFPEYGGILREDLYTALETTLGPTRFDRFMDVTTGQFDADFNYFGDASHTIIFEPVYSPDDDSLQWRIRDGWIIREEDASKTIRATESLVRELPDHYYKYVHYLPAYLFVDETTQ